MSPAAPPPESKKRGGYPLPAAWIEHDVAVAVATIFQAGLYPSLTVNEIAGIMLRALMRGDDPCEWIEHEIAARRPRAPEPASDEPGEFIPAPLAGIPKSIEVGDSVYVPLDPDNITVGRVAYIGDDGMAKIQLAEGGTSLGFLAEFQQAARAIMRPSDPMHPPKHVQKLLDMNIARGWNIAPPQAFKEWLVEQNGSLHAISRRQAENIGVALDRAASMYMSFDKGDESREAVAGRATWTAVTKQIKAAHERAEAAK